MPIKSLLFLLLFLMQPTIRAQQVQSPSAFLGYELGTQFTRHHRVMDYYEHLAENDSKRIQLVAYGTTYENRPLMLAYISSEENMARLDQIRQEHLENINGNGKPTKAIVWMSYNVHGNESVSTEASMQTVYELLTKKQEYLKNTVVIIDPCVNPDGRERYVNWYYQYKNSPNQIDPNSKEHHEPWLNGRPNHYMFDLNRDWAWLTQKESQQRIKFYNQWLPHIHVDFHEQEVDSPYYFAPAAEPFHEVITDFQREFQVTVGKNHAKYFDANGWFYFTKEVFDLLYPSYGDTYPTYNGSIGMTYEQGGSGRAGLGITTSIGDTLSLKDRIEHHLTTGLSTLEVATENTAQLNEEFKKFHESKNYRFKSYVLNGNPDHIKELTALLDQHEIEYGMASTNNAKGYLFEQGKSGNLRTSQQSLVVPITQNKGTLVKVLFEPNAKLTDSLTYDITAWSLPFAYGLEAVASEAAIGYNPVRPETSIKDNAVAEGAYAYLTKWNSFNDAQFLSELIKEGIRVRYAKKPFVQDGRSYERGSLIITQADNQFLDDFIGKLSKAASKHKRELFPTQTGFVEGGKDFGSSSVGFIKDSRVAILSGQPTSTLRFGEIWHFFERQLNYPVTVIDTEYFKQIDLSEYDILILPDGDDYNRFLDKEVMGEIKNWVQQGGKLVAMGAPLKTLAKQKTFSIGLKKIERDSSFSAPSFEMNQREQIKQEITGAIFKTTVDNTHPLAFGYKKDYFSLKLGSDAYEYLDKGTVVFLDARHSKPIAGFAGSEAQKKIGETLVFGSEKQGKGTVVYMVDNPLFRGFWQNGKLFFANALFMID
ncbi:MAG: zinc carboxypeptidase [Pseudozobellia sp.]|nr:zinc carboxypeptidase [Pseudozobellia sp.]